MTVHINLSDRKSYLLSIADAVQALCDEAGFRSGDQARITCGDLKLPSGEIISLTGLLFERGNRHVYTVWLRSSKTCRARYQSELLNFETAELADAVVDNDSNVTLIDGRVIRAVQITPTKLPYIISNRDWRIVHAAISAAEAEHRSYAIPLPANPQQIAEARNLNLIDYGAVSSIKAPYLKVIKGTFLRQNSDISSLSEQKISDTLSKFGIRHKRARPRRATI